MHGTEKFSAILVIKISEWGGDLISGIPNKDNGNFHERLEAKYYDTYFKKS